MSNSDIQKQIRELLSNREIKLIAQRELLKKSLGHRIQEISSEYCL